MDRRGFLKAAVAVPAAAYMPVAESDALTAPIKCTVELSGYQMGPWYAIVNPAQERDIRDMAARERWSYAKLRWREDGKPELSCQQIIERYTPASDRTVDVTELGRYEGFRFIESSHAA